MSLDYNDAFDSAWDNYSKQYDLNLGAASRQETIKPAVATTGNALYDFLGQFAWGATEALTLETLGVADTYAEAMARPGEEVDTWEESFAGEAAGDWDQLTGWGRGGYILGQALGSIPSFFYGGLFAKGAVATGKGAIGLGSKVLGKTAWGDAAKFGVKKSTKEITEAFGKKELKEGLAKAGVEVDDVLAKTIADETYDNFMASSVKFSLEEGFQREAFEEIVSLGIKDTLSKTLKIADDSLLTPLSKEVLEIATRNSPIDAQKSLYLLTSKLTNIWGVNKVVGHKVNSILAASAYDALIGIGMGTLKGAVHSIQKGAYGVERNDYGEYEFTGDFHVTPGMVWDSALHHAATDAYHFAFLGPAKFVKGGTSMSHAKKLRGIIGNHVRKYWKSPKLYKDKDKLRQHLSAMDAISGQRLSKVFKEYEHLGSQWWMKKGADIEMMKGFLTKLRTNFNRQAYWQWTKEFGVDVIHSLPRMFAGTVAMNLPNMIEIGKQNGWNWDSMKTALGETAPEIAANVWTAAWFTRRPHSFHAPTNSKIFNRVFETGQIRQYNAGSYLMGMVNFKARQFEKTLAMVKTVSAKDAESLGKIVSAWDMKNHRRRGAEAKLLGEEFEQTYEFNEIKSAVDAADAVNQRLGTDLRVAYDKALADKVKAGEITETQVVELLNQKYVAEEVLDLYKRSTGHRTNELKFTPETAFDFVNRVTNIEWNQKKLNINNVSTELNLWKDKAIAKAAEKPQDLYKDFLEDVYKILELNYDRDPITDKITAPEIKLASKDIQTKLGAGDLALAIVDVQTAGRENNWLVTDRGNQIKPTRDMSVKLEEAFVSHSSAFMEMVHGSNWAKDPLVSTREVRDIMSNPTWMLSFDRSVRMKQRLDAYELLTEGKEHTYDPNDAANFNERLNRFVRYEKAPTIDIKHEANENYGKYKQYIENMHEITSILHPDAIAKSKEAPMLTFKEAQTLYETGTSLTGDLFVDSKKLIDFKGYAVERAIDKLGLDNMNLKLDYRAAAAHLVLDPTFNRGEAGNVRLPDYGTISEQINKLRGNKLSNKNADELLKFYETFVDKMGNANFPAKFQKASQGMVESADGDFVLAIRKAHAVGQLSMDKFLGDSQWQVHRSLTREQDRLESMIKQLENGVFDPEKKIIVKNNELLSSLANTADRVRDLKSLVKVALEEKDPYLLRALEKESNNIKESMLALEKQGVNDKSLELYAGTLNEIHTKIQSDRQARAFTEHSLKNAIVEEMKRFAKDVPAKDVHDIMIKLNANQFKAKYKFTNKAFEQIFALDKSNKAQATDIKAWVKEILSDFYLNESKEFESWKAQNRSLVSNFETLERTLKGLPNIIDMDVKTKIGQDNFNNMVRKPLILAMEKAVSEMPISERPNRSVIFEDAHSVAQAHFSKTIVKAAKVDLKHNKLITTDKSVGYAKDRGFTGILEYLDPSQKAIFLLEKGGVDFDGKVVTDFTGKNLTRLNKALAKGDFEMIHGDAKAQVYRHQDVTLLKSQNNQKGPIQDRAFIAIPMNESTALVIRTDRAGGLHKSISANFRAPNKSVNDKGGELYQIVKAIYDGDLNLPGKKYQVMRDILGKLKNEHTMSVNELVEGVKLTRSLLNFPGFIDQIVSGGSVDLEAKAIRDIAKRDKMNEPKNGFIPTQENLIKSGIMYENSQSSLHNRAYNMEFTDVHGNVTKIKDWFDPNKKKGMKIASVNDEGDIMVNGRKVDNIFSSMDRAKYDFGKELQIRKDLFAKKKISIEELRQYEKEYEINMKAAEAVSKSIVDGEMYNTFESQLANMMFYGLNPEMVRISQSTGEILGFKSGGIKPTITHAKVTTEATDYGRIQQFYVKTAMKYDPQVEILLKKWNVDALVFKSSNKINTLKTGINETQKEMYLNPEGTTFSADFDKNQSWVNYIEKDHKVKTIEGKDMQQNAKNAGESIVEVPFESFNIRSVSREHDPMVGQNAAVHMRHDSGISEWIGLSGKLKKYEDMYHDIQGDVIQRTAIAKAVLGHNAETGDPSMINSVMSNVLLRDGLILEPHLLRKLERDLITYNLNNGAIAGGVVPEGSLDVMTADLGHLRPTVRSKIKDRPTVRLYGEFTPSFYAANKPFKRYGDVSNGSSSEVQNVVIQRRRYIAEDGVKREADMFVVELDQGKKFVQVEGRMIDKKGNILDIDAYIDGIGEKSIIKTGTKSVDTQMKKYNQSIYEQAIKSDKLLFELKDATGDYYLSSKYKLFEVAAQLENIVTKQHGISHAFSLGMLNVRQPRNMMGDVVISKLAKDPTTGNFHTDMNSGNLSRMNFLDAISPQDADFDFDKSFNYTAAPARYWTQTNKVAGHVTSNSMSEVQRIFNPYSKEKLISNKIKELYKNETTADIIETEANLARGQFIKMHQTLTYLGNIFRGGGVVAEFDSGHQRIQVRLNIKGKYHSTVDNISEAAKMWIDLYKAPPSLEASEFANIKRFQNEIWFGREGIFELNYVDKQKPDKITPFNLKAYREGLNDPYFNFVSSSIRNTIIDPLNKYLKYNKGLIEDPSGISSKATLKAYHDAYDYIINLSVNGSNYMVDKGVNMKPGLNHMGRYFSESSAPYDVAMSRLYQTYHSSSKFKKSGNVGNSQPEYLAIMEFIERGFAPGDVGMSYEKQKGKIIDHALREYVREEADALKAIDLRNHLKKLQVDLQEREAFFRGPKDQDMKAQEIKQKIARASEILTTIEESLSYKFLDDPVNPPTTMRNIGHAKETFTNNTKNNLVIIGYDGNIKEVILKGRKNTKSINKGDKIVVNGRHFKITDPHEQLGLKMLHNSFAEVPVIIDANGNHHPMHYGGLKADLNVDIKRLNAEILSLENLPKQTKTEKDAYYLERERVLHKHLFELGKAGREDIYRQAFIIRLLTPGISKKMIAYKAVGLDNLQQGSKGYYYFESAHSESVMSLLTKMVSGDFKGDKIFAESVLKDIEVNKMIGYAKTKNPDLDVKILKSRMISSDIGQGTLNIPSNAVLRPLMIHPKVYEQLQSTEANKRNAAKLLIDYAQGKGAVDPVLLYRASKVLEKAGIGVREQWGRTEFITNPDGTLKRYGATKLRITEADKIRRKDLGEHGGSKKSVLSWSKELISCYFD